MRIDAQDQLKSNWPLLVVGAVALVLTYVSVCWRNLFEPRISGDDLDKIHWGMPIREVEAALGRPPDYSILDADGEPEMHWKGSEGELEIRFASNGKVVDRTFHYSDPRWFEKEIRRKILLNQIRSLLSTPFDR